MGNLYHGLLSFCPAFPLGRAAMAIAAGLAGCLMLVATPSSQTSTPFYTLITADGRRPLPFRVTGQTDVLPLDQIATLFDLRVQEDAAAGGLTVLARNQRIVLTPGQSLASVGGRIVSLSGAVSRQGQAWFVPVDFLSRAVGPAMNLRIDVRRASHLIVVGDVRVPQVAPHFERQGPNGQLTLEIQPPAGHHVSRDGNRLTIRFDADGLDATTIVGAQPEFVGAARVDGSSLVVDLGPSAASFRADDSDPAHLTIDLLSAPPAVTPGRPAPAQEPAPVVDLAPSGIVRSIVIDPGHGGEDNGVKGAGGTLEKNVTLQVARRLKAAIESRVGLHVLLTRETDETVAVDRRTALANNSKADLLISLHANASLRPGLRGAEVLSLSLDDYKDRARGLRAGTPVPVAGGGTRLIVAVPWDLAQIPYASKSAALAGVLVRHLTDLKVPLYAHATDQAPLRILVGANMPAVVVELGFLSNADDERALTGNDVPAAIVEALLGTIVEVRNGLPTGGPR